MADPPRVRSSAVAENVTGRAAPGGSAEPRTLPAHSLAASVSPLGRAIVKAASVTSAAESEGVPSSWAVMRNRYRSPFVTVPRFHVYVRREPASVAIGVQVCPASALASTVKLAIPTPDPYAAAVQSTVREGPWNTPPLGEVMFTSGWSRSKPEETVLTSHRRAASRMAARVGLAAFSSLAVVSRLVISKAKYARRGELPPPVPMPAAPIRAAESHPRPTRRVEGGPPLDRLSS